ncbi:hypothetical protein N665_0004s0091 [Sinapis alba]|nr:hypothetical protein N665_0004s0091 [Sinapis alba]
MEMFLLRYAFQCSVHTIWRERNERKHGKGSQTADALLKFIDKGIRNRISSLRVSGRRRYATAMATWLVTRE